MAREPDVCRNCGNEIVLADDGSLWLHAWTMDLYCPQRVAEPDTSRWSA